MRNADVDFWNDYDFRTRLFRRSRSGALPIFGIAPNGTHLLLNPFSGISSAVRRNDDPMRLLLHAHGLERQTELWSALSSALDQEKLLDEVLLAEGLFDAFQSLTQAPPSKQPAFYEGVEKPKEKDCAAEQIVPVDKPHHLSKPIIKAESSVEPPKPEMSHVDRRVAFVSKPDGIPERRQAATRLSDFERTRPSVQRSKRIVQVSGVLGPMGGDPADHMVEARNTILNWAKEKGASIPERAFNGEAFELDLSQTKHPIAVEAAGDCWAMQFDTQPDQIGETVWRTEVVLLKTRERAQIGLGLTAIDPRGTEAIRHSSIPNVIRRLAAGVGLFDDGRLLDATPLPTDTANDADRLIALIESPKRTRAVVVVSSDQTSRTLISATHLAARLAGVAHVASIDGETSRELTRRYGKQMSVFGLAVRVYRAAFNPDTDSPTRHPLFVGERWLERERFVGARILEIAAEETTKTGHEGVPTFHAVRRYIEMEKLEEAKRVGLSHSEKTVLLIKENARLLKDCADSDELLVQAEAERDNALALFEEHKEVARRWSVRAAWLEARVRDLTEALGTIPNLNETPLPCTWDGMEEWAEQTLGGSVRLLPQALRVARKSVFTEISLVYEAVKLLGECYQPMRAARSQESREAYLSELQRLKLEVSEVGEALTNHRTEAHYKTIWKDRQISLNMHVTGSSSRQQQRGFRLYFYYDEEDDIVVVGHFPTHLPNNLT